MEIKFVYISWLILHHTCNQSWKTKHPANPPQKKPPENLQSYKTKPLITSPQFIFSTTPSSLLAPAPLKFFLSSFFFIASYYSATIAHNFVSPLNQTLLDKGDTFPEGQSARSLQKVLDVLLYFEISSIY